LVYTERDWDKRDKVIPKKDYGNLGFSTKLGGLLRGLPIWFGPEVFPKKEALKG